MIDWLYILPECGVLAFWAGLLAGLMVALPFLPQPFKGHSAVDPQVTEQTTAIIEARKGG